MPVKIEIDNLPASIIYKLTREGDQKELEKILESNETARKQIDHLDEKQCSPLHYAARYCYIEIVRLLLQKYNAKVDMAGSDGMTPFHYACRYGKKNGQQKGINPDDNNVDVLKIMREHNKELLKRDDKKNKDILLTTDDFELTGLHHACMRGNIQVVKYLVNEGKDNNKLIDAQDKQGNTALHIAATYGHIQIVKILIHAGANIRIKCTDQEQNILHKAAKGGQAEVMEYLAEQLEFMEMANQKDKSGMSVLFLAVDGGDLKLITLLLNKGLDSQLKEPNDEPEYPLHSAARTGQYEVVKLILKHDANISESIDRRNQKSETALHLAAENNHLEIVKLLLENGADCSLQEKSFLTPMMVAAIENNTDILEELIRQGAELEQVDKKDHNILHLICYEGNDKILEMLLEHKDKDISSLINDDDQFDETPLHLAAKKGHVKCVELLLKSDADIDNMNEDEQSPCHLAAKAGHSEVVKAIIKKDTMCVKDRDENNNTPLHLAASNGHCECVRLLLENNSKVTDQNDKNWTALDCAAANGCCTCVEILLDYDSPVNPVDRDNTTPLHVAAKYGHHKVIELLLNNNADITILDYIDNRNALEVAIAKGKRNVVEVILNSDVWRKSLRSTSSYKDERSEELVLNTPMRMLIRTFPDLAEQVLDKCITTTKEKGSQEETKIELEFIDDAYNYKKVSGKDEESLRFEYAHINAEGDIETFPKPYISNSTARMENHPLMIMIKNKEFDLLRHPLSMAIFREKWKYFGRFFFLEFAMYLTFLTSLTTYSLFTLNETTSARRNETFGDSVASHVLYDSGLKESRLVTRWITFVLAVLGICSEIIQMYRMRSRYFKSFSNLIDVLVYSVSIGFIWDISLNITFDTCQSYQCWHWPTGSFLLVTAWLNLFGYVKFFPYFGIFVIMVLNILKTVAHLSIMIALFVAAFTFGFHILLIEQEPFNTFGWSYFKTFHMTMSGYDYEGLYGEDNLPPFPAANIILCVLFVAIMGIVIMNLFTGLAIDEISKIQNNAELEKLSAQIELVLGIEKTWRWSAPNLTIKFVSKTKQRNLWTYFKSFWRSNEITSRVKILEVQSQRAEAEREDDKLDNLAQQVKLLRHEISRMKESISNLYPSTTTQ